MMRRFSDPFRGFVIACLTIALLVIGFAHRMPTMAEAALQSYVAAGGSVAALCHDGDETPQIQTAKCPVCHLTAQCLLPKAGIGLRPATRILAFDPPALVAERPPVARRDHAHASRAPPAIA